MGRPINQRKALTKQVIEKAVSFGSIQLMAAIIINVPFLGWPVFRQATEWLVKRFLRSTLNEVVTGANLILIKVIVDGDVKLLNYAMKIAHELPEDATEKEKEDVNKNIELALRGLIRVGRSKF